MKQTQEQTQEQEKIRTITIRIPQDLWRSLHLAKIDGKIESVTSALTMGGYMVLDRLKEEEKVWKGAF